MTELLNHVKLLYGADIVNENMLGNATNIIYEINSGTQPAILRISKHSEHKLSHIGFELTWMNDLAQHVPQIAGPIPSLRGKLFEVINTQKDCWIACVFNKAPGHIVDPSNPMEWNETLFYKIGELMGNMHTHTKPYIRQIGINRQFDWRHSYLFWPDNTQWNDSEIQPVWNRTLA